MASDMGLHCLPRSHVKDDTGRKQVTYVFSDMSTPKKDAQTILGGDTIETITASTTGGSAMTYEILRISPAMPGFFSMDPSKCVTCSH